MPYDLTDAFLDVSDLKAAVLELQAKVFPERFKTETEEAKKEETKKEEKK